MVPFHSTCNSRWTSLDPRTVAITESIGKWIAIDGEPPHVVEKPCFQAFMQEQHPSFPGTTHPTISSRIQNYADGFIAWFRAFHTKIDWWAATTDGWTSDNNEVPIVHMSFLQTWHVTTYVTLLVDWCLWWN